MPVSAAEATAAFDQVLELALLLDEDMERELTARGLTKARTRVLWEVARRPAAHQQELAAAVGVAPRTMTGLVDSLVSTGFVARSPDPEDRRAQRVELTTQGRDAAEWLVSSRVDLAVSLFAGMGGKQLACFTEGLSEVIGRLRTAIEAAATGGVRQ